MNENFQIINKEKTLEILAQQALETLSNLQTEARERKNNEEKYKSELIDINIGELNEKKEELALFNKIKTALTQSHIPPLEYEELLKEVNQLQMSNRDYEGYAKDKNVNILFAIMRDDLTSLYKKVIENEINQKADGKAVG